MDVIRKEMMDGTAIFVMTLGRGSTSIIFFRCSCRWRSASVMDLSSVSKVSYATVSYDTYCSTRGKFVKSGQYLKMALVSAGCF